MSPLTTPFEIAPDPFHSPANQSRLLKAAAEMDAGAGTIHDLVDETDTNPLTTPSPSAKLPSPRH